ncbi:N-acyltransferase YncA, partial [Dysosmobacter welbionis]
AGPADAGAVFDHRHCLGDVLRLRGLPPPQCPVLHRPGAVPLHHADQCVPQRLYQAEKGGLTEHGISYPVPPAPAVRQGPAGGAVLLRLPHLRAAGSDHRLYLLPGRPIHQLGAAVYPVQLYQRHHRYPAQYPQHALYHPAVHGDRAAPGRGRRHLSDGVRHQPASGGCH